MPARHTPVRSNRSRSNSRRILRTVALSACSVSFACADASLPSGLEHDETPSFHVTDAQTAIEGPQWVVVFREGAGDPAAAAARLASEVGAEVLHVYRHALQGMAISAPEAAAEALGRNPLVASVEADGVVFPDGTQSSATWGIDRVDQRDLPLSGTYTYNYGGTDVRAYIIDSGIDVDHPELGGRVVLASDYVNDGTDDCNGHGTHVAGTIGSQTYGLAKNVGLYSVRVFPCSGGASFSTIIAAVDFVTGEKTANPSIPMVANMSLGGGYYAPANTAVTNSIAAGVTYAISAGNDNGDACTKSPASTPNAITVASSTNTDVRSSFSNFGTCVDVFAPGSSIRSTYYGGGTATMSGTSMAAPHVAGLAALYLGANPTATPAAVTQAITLNATADKITDAGTGSPNLLIYSLFSPLDGTDSVPPIAAFIYSKSYLAVTFTDQSFDNGTIVSRAWDFGDGATSTATNPGHTYAAGGTYTVTLTVTDNDGETGSTTQSVTVAPNQPPVAGFTFTKSNLTASFTDRSTDADGTIASRSWNFGDGGTSTATNPSRTYASAGTYTVTLTVTDNFGATSTVSQPVTVTAPVVNVTSITMALSARRGTYTVQATVYTAKGSIVTGELSKNSTLLSTVTATASSKGTAVLSTTSGAASGDVFSVKLLNGATGITTCSIPVGVSSFTCR